MQLDLFSHGGEAPEPQAKRKVRSQQEVMRVALEIIKEKGGTVQSVERRTNLIVRCHKGHVWNVKSYTIAAGEWCYRCFRDRQQYTLDEMRSIARERGGECLSTGDNYIKSDTKVKWRCGLGHEWEAPAARARRGRSWCRKCGNLIIKEKRTLKDGLDRAKRVAIKKGGECLSTEYVGVGKLLRWKCGNGHEWSSSLSNIENGTWCPRCRNWRREEMCRLILEGVYGAPFPPSRPEWLRNGKGNKLALDGYNAELGIAFEHNGLQHYKYVKHFHRDEKTLDKRVQADGLKWWLCNANGVILLEVPYTIADNVLPKWISDELVKLGAPKQKYAASSVCVLTATGVSALQKLRDHASSRGGECLSSEYFGAAGRCKFRCKEEHEWTTQAMHVLYRGTWCRKCALIRATELARLSSKTGRYPRVKPHPSQTTLL